MGGITFRGCVVQACPVCSREDLGLGQSVKCVLGWVAQAVWKAPGAGKFEWQPPQQQRCVVHTEAGDKRGGTHRAGEGTCCGCRDTQTVLLCLTQTLGITQPIHPRLSASVRAQHLPPPCEVLFMSERSGRKKVGWHHPAAGWMPLELSPSMKAQLCCREDQYFKASYCFFPPSFSIFWGVFRGAEAPSKG